MALTPEEQAELEQLQGMRPATGLSGAEQQELQQLQQMQSPTERDKAFRVDMSNNLGLIKRTMPKSVRRPTFPATGQQQTQFASRLRAARADREKATAEFLARGGTPEQLQIAQGILNKVDAPPTLGRSVGATVGSIGLPLAVNLIPGMAALPEEAVTFPLAASLFGAGLGGAVGEATQIGIQEGRMAQKSELLKAALKEVAFEAGGRGVAKSAKLAFSPFIKQAVPDAAALADDFAKFGGVLPPSALDKRMSLTIADEVARGGFAARQIQQDIAERNVDAFGAYSDSIMDMMARGLGQKGKLELGKEFAEGITRPNGTVFNTMDDIFTPLYNKIDELAPEARVSTKKLRNFAISELRKDKSLLRKGATKRGALLTEAGRDQLETVAQLKDDLTFQQLRDFRSKLLKDTRKFSRDADQAEGLVKKLSGLTNDTLFDNAAAKNLPPEATNLLKNTNRLYKSAMEALDTTFSEKLLKRLEANPSAVLGEVFPANNPQAIEQLRKALIEPVSGKPSREGQRLFAQLRTAWAADALEKSTREGIPSSTIFESQLRRMTPEAVAEMFPDAEGKRQLNNLKGMIKLLGKRPSGEASLLIRSGQAGGLALMYKGAKEGDSLQVAAGGALVMGPVFLARLAKNKLGNSLLRAGINVPKGSSKIAPIAARMINLTNQVKSQEARREERARMAVRVTEAAKQAEETKRRETARGRGFRF